MKIIDEQKVKEIIMELKGKQGLFRNLIWKSQSDDTRKALTEDIDDISHLITSLEQLADAPADTWTLEVGEE